MTKTLLNVKPNIKGLGKFALAFFDVAANEPKGYRGITHLCEHVICEGFKPFEEEANSNGLSFNAYTSMDDVVCYIEGLEETLKDYKYKFIDSLLNYIPSKEVFERERKIVLSEYTMAMANPISEFSYNFMRKYFNFYAPLGIRKDIEEITYESFLEYYNKYFKKCSQIINYSQNKLDFDISNFIKSNNLKEVKFKPKIYKQAIIEHNNTTNNEVIFNVRFLDKSYYKKDIKKLMYWDIFASYLSEGLSSPLVKRIREKLGIYFISASFTKIFNSCAYFDISAQSSIEMRYEVNNRIKEVIEEEIKNLDKDRFEKMLSSIRNKIKITMLDKDFNFYYRKYNRPKDFKYNKQLMNTNLSFDEFKKIIQQDFNSVKDYTEFATEMKANA